MEGGITSQSSRWEGGDVGGAGEGDMEQEGAEPVTQGASTPQHTQKRESSAVSIQLFAMDEMYEMRSVDFLPAIFELFPVSHPMHAHTHTHTYVRTYVHVLTACTQVRMNTYMLLRMYVCVCALCMHVCMYVAIDFTYLHTHVIVLSVNFRTKILWS